MKKKIIGSVPILIVLLAAIYSVLPSIINYKDALMYLGDDILITWILNQTIEKVFNGIGEIFTGNIFYPFKNTMVYSVMLVPSAIIGYIPVKLTGSYVSAFNVARVFGQISSMLILYFWFKEMFKDKWAAMVGSTVFGLSQIHNHYLAHLHVWNMQWWLGGLWLIWRYTRNGKVWQIYLAGLLLAIQVWENPLEAYRTLIPAAFILLPYIKELKKIKAHLFKVLLMVLLIISPYIYSYVGFVREFNYVRPIREVAHFSMSVNNLWEHFFSPGLFGLFVLSFVLIGFNRLKSDKNFKWLAATAIASLVLSLGPVLKWKDMTMKFFGKVFIPLPYILLYYVIPGFQAMRTPSRWMVMMGFGMAGIAALSLSKYKGKYKMSIISAALFIAVIGGQKINMNLPKAQRPEEFPEVYNWLEKQTGNVVLEYPMYTWASEDNGLQKEFFRMMYSLKHKKNLINGGSGYMPLSRQKLLGEINKDFPGEDIVGKLKEIDTDYIIVHKNEIKESKYKEIENWGETLVVWEDVEEVVYQLP